MSKRAKNDIARASRTDGGGPAACGQPSQPAASRWVCALSAVVIVAAGLTAYFNSFDGVFLYDDHQSIAGNPHIRKLWPPAEPLSLALWQTGATVDRRPALSLSFALTHAVFGRDPWGYHAVNLAIHIAAALMLFGIVRRTVRAHGLLPGEGYGPEGLALAATLVWVVHPLNTAAVTYIVQRAESLMGLLLLTTLYCSIRGFHAHAHRWRWYVPAVAACAMGMAVKEVMGVAPLVVLVYDRVFGRGPGRKHWALHGALAATWLVLAGLLAATLRDDVQNDFTARSPLKYLLTQPGVILHYLRLAVWPDPLVADYNWPWAQTVGQMVPPGLVIIVLLGLTVWGVVRRAWWGFVGAWFFLILGPSSSFAALMQRAQEQRMYLPLIAVVVLAVVAGYWLVGRIVSLLVSTRRPRLTAAAGLLLLLPVTASLAARTHYRNRDYANEQDFWEKTIGHRDSSAVAHYQLGHALRKQGHIDRSLPYYRRALELGATRYDAHSNLGHALVLAGRRARLARESQRAHKLLAEAVDVFKALAQRRPDLSEPHVGWGKALMARDDLEGAVTQFQTALDISPNDAWARTELGSVRMRQGRPHLAIPHFRQAVESNPHEAELRILFGRALVTVEQVDAAIEQFQAATELDRDYAPAHANLGLALLKKNRPVQAIDHFRQVLRITPEDLQTINNLAWVLATHPDNSVRNGVEAVNLARRACEMTNNRNPVLLGTMAAGYAEMGQYDLATQTVDRAIVLAGQSAPDRVSDYRRHRICYVDRRPFRNSFTAEPR